MRKKLILFTVLALIFCGCSMDKRQVQEKKEVSTPEPNVRAFQDPFTKKFLTSTKEVLPGYYPFLSKTGRYEMAFPAGGIIGEKSYEIKRKSIESIAATVHVGNYDPIKEVSASLKMDYLSYYDKETVEASLDSVQKQLGDKWVLKKLALKDRDIYWSTYSYTESKYEYCGVAGYVQNTVDKGGIYFSYHFTCNPSFEKCQQLEKDFNLKTALDWVKQIRFK